MPTAPPELHGEGPLVDLGELGAGAVEAGEPLGRLQAKGERQRLLEQRAPGGKRPAMGVGQARTGVRRGGQVLDDRGERPAGDQHHRGVEDVLTGGALVHVGGGCIAQAIAQLAQYSGNRCAFLAGRAADRGDVEVGGVAGGGHLLRGVRCGQAGVREGTGQGELDIEHCLQKRLISGLRRRPTTSEEPGKQSVLARVCAHPAARYRFRETVIPGWGT